jgi:hypothetical protein
MKRIPWGLLVLSCFLGLSEASYSLCVDNRHPTIADEYASSTYVIRGILESERKVTTSDDPEGVAATIYTVRPLELFKGAAIDVLIIWSENTTSRFPMIKGTQYLLFLKESPDGFYVDNCGNSGATDNKNTGIVISEVRSLVSTKAK